MNAEKLYYTALIAYIWYEAPDEDQNFSMLIDLVDASEAREDDENFKNEVDLLFNELVLSDKLFEHCAEIDESGTKPHGADRAGAGKAVRRDRTAESRKPNGMGAANERLQGADRGSCESGIDL